MSLVKDGMVRGKKPQGSEAVGPSYFRASRCCRWSRGMQDREAVEELFVADGLDVFVFDF